MLHPRNDHCGMGCLEAACAAATVHNGASRWNKALLDNGARPSGALVYDPLDCSTLSTDQFTGLKDELAAEFSGRGNAGRPLLLEGGFGLDDEKARRHVDELRELLSAWRDAKRSVARAVVTWAVSVLSALLLIGLAVRLRLTELVTG